MPGLTLRSMANHSSWMREPSDSPVSFYLLPYLAIPFFPPLLRSNNRVDVVVVINIQILNDGIIGDCTVESW